MITLQIFKIYIFLFAMGFWSFIIGQTLKGVNKENALSIIVGGIGAAIIIGCLFIAPFFLHWLIFIYWR